MHCQSTRHGRSQHCKIPDEAVQVSQGCDEYRRAPSTFAVGRSGCGGARGVDCSLR